MTKRLNGFQLKMIAIVIMVLDHTGALFFPDMVWIRIIGRLAFPLFAFFIARGFEHTRSIQKYLLRLGMCAVLFQVPAWLFGFDYGLNIFITLFLGLLAITALDYSKKRNHAGLGCLSVVILAVIADLIHADYGAYGVLYILIFYIAGSFLKMVQGVALLHVAYAFYGFAFLWVTTGAFHIPNLIQVYSVFSLVLIAIYNGEQGRKMKYFFYLFYPTHLMALYLIDWLI